MNLEETKILIHHRLEQAKESLEDARFLLEANRTSRSIINRCYYAMFYAALALQQSTGTVSTKHRGVLSAFDQDFIRTELLPKQLSRDFHRAFDLRQAADYKSIQSPDITVAQELFEKATRFIQNIRQYLSEQGWA